MLFTPTELQERAKLMNLYNQYAAMYSENNALKEERDGAQARVDVKEADMVVLKQAILDQEAVVNGLSS